MDPLSLTASVIGVASAGLGLSASLYRYTETVINADKSIKDIARDLSITSSLIRELGTLLQQDRRELRCEAALATASDALHGCDEVFKEIQKVLDQNINLSEKGSFTMSKLKRLKWPLLEPRMQILQSRLERLKNTLVLVLSVINYSRDAREHVREHAIADDGRSISRGITHQSSFSDSQRSQVERLISLNEEANERSQYLEMMIRRFELMLGGSPNISFNQEASMNTQQLYGTSSREHKEISFNTWVKQLTSLSGSSAGSSCISGHSTPHDHNSFHTSRQDLKKYANHARSILKAVEAAQSNQEMVEQCEPIQIICKDSLEALAALSMEPKRPSRLRRLFLKAPTRSHRHEITVPANRVSEVTDIPDWSARAMPSSRRTTLPPPYVATVPVGGPGLDLE